MEKENALRIKLSAACHVVAKEGHSDTTLGHLSARIGPDTFLMKPSGFGLEEVGPEDFIIINIDGQKLAGEHMVHREIPIHTEIYRMRPEVNCVLHTHPQYSVVFSATGEELKPISNMASMLYPVPRFTATIDLVVTRELGRRLAICLGKRRAVLMQNHGIVVVGESIEEAAFNAINLEKACQMQLMVINCSHCEYGSAEEIEAKKQQISKNNMGMDKWKYYLRKWKEEDALSLY